MSRPWRPLEQVRVGDLPVCTGVFALRNRWTSDEQIFVAGGRSRWGIRGEVARLLDDVVTVDHELAYAPTTNYWTLYRERVAFPQRFDDDRPFQRRSPIAEFS